MGGSCCQHQVSDWSAPSPFWTMREMPSIQPASKPVLPLQRSGSTDADAPLKHLPTAIVQHVATCSVKLPLYYTYSLQHATTGSKAEFPVWKLEIPNFTSDFFFFSIWMQQNFFFNPVKICCESKGVKKKTHCPSVKTNTFWFCREQQFQRKAGESYQNYLW